VASAFAELVALVSKWRARGVKDSYATNVIQGGEWNFAVSISLRIA
jgi:hypothetical protein